MRPDSSKDLALYKPFSYLLTYLVLTQKNVVADVIQQKLHFIRKKNKLVF